MSPICDCHFDPPIFWMAWSRQRVCWLNPPMCMHGWSSSSLCFLTRSANSALILQCVCRLHLNNVFVSSTRPSVCLLDPSVCLLFWFGEFVGQLHPSLCLSASSRLFVSWLDLVHVFADSIRQCVCWLNPPMCWLTQSVNVFVCSLDLANKLTGSVNHLFLYFTYFQTLAFPISVENFLYFPCFY